MSPDGGVEPTRSVDMAQADDVEDSDVDSRANDGNKGGRAQPRAAPKGGRHRKPVPAQRRAVGAKLTGRKKPARTQRRKAPNKHADLTNRQLLRALSQILGPLTLSAENANPNAATATQRAATSPANPANESGELASNESERASDPNTRPTDAAPRPGNAGNVTSVERTNLERTLADVQAANANLLAQLENATNLLNGTHGNPAPNVVPLTVREKRKWLTKPPTFKPGGDLSLLDWDTICVNYYTEGAWDPNEWVSLAITSLDATLQRILHTHMRLNDKRPGDYTWDEFMALIRTLTGTREAERIARDEFDAFDWEGGVLDAHTNHRRFEDILRRCGEMAPDSETVLRKYTLALPYKIHARVFPKPGGGRWELTDLMRAVDMLTAQERMREATKEIAKTEADKPSSSTPNANPGVPKPKKRGFVEKTTDEFRWLMANKRCLKCGGAGHRKDACSLKGEAAENALRKTLANAPIKNKGKADEGKGKGKKRKGN